MIDIKHRRRKIDGPRVAAIILFLLTRDEDVFGDTPAAGGEGEAETDVGGEAETDVEGEAETDVEGVGIVDVELLGDLRTKVCQRCGTSNVAEYAHCSVSTDVSPMAELRVSIAASWPQGSKSDTGGPCHRGE